MLFFLKNIFFSFSPITFSLLINFRKLYNMRADTGVAMRVFMRAGTGVDRVSVVVDMGTLLGRLISSSFFSSLSL